MTHEFSIPAADLDAGGRSYSFAVRPAWVRGALEAHEATAGAKEGRLEIRASKSGSDVVVHGQLEAELVAPCARCLEPVTIPVKQEISALFVPAGKLESPKEPEYEFGSDEADTFAFDGDTVVLDELVRDELVLETPMIPLCSEDCPGMSPPSPSKSASSDKPVDPRLAPLLAIKPAKS
jgi:uncharacterized protein